MAFRKLVGSYKDYTLSTHILEDGYLAVDVDTGSLRLGDGSTAGGIEVSSGGGSSSSLGDLHRSAHLDAKILVRGSTSNPDRSPCSCRL